MSNLGEEKNGENPIEGEAVSEAAGEARTEGASDDPATANGTSAESTGECPEGGKEPRTESTGENPEGGKEPRTDGGAGTRKRNGFTLGSKGKLAIIIAAAVIIVALIVSAVVLSFGDRSYDEEEVIAAARELLPTARKLYSIYYGNGILYLSSGYSDGDYRQADPTHLAYFDIGSIEDLRRMSYLTFSNDYCEDIFSNYLESYEEDGIVYNWARYVQVYDTMDITKPAYILVYSKHDGVFEDRMTYDLSSIRAVRSKGEFVYMTVDVTVENIDGEQQTATIDFTLFEEASGWKIASPAFANYNKYLDHELLK